MPLCDKTQVKPSTMLPLYSTRPSDLAPGRNNSRADFEAYLDGFSPNVQEILDKFEFRNQVSALVKTLTFSEA